MFTQLLPRRVTTVCAILAHVSLLYAALPAAAAAANTQASAPARSASGIPSRVNSPGSLNRAGTGGRSVDNRSVIVESNLRSINRSLDENRPASPTLPAPSPCPSCGERADVLPSDTPRKAADASLRSSLHKLKREGAIQQSTDSKRTRIEASQPD